VSAGGGESITTDEATIVTESLLDPIVMEDCESDGCLPDSTGTNESDRREVFRQTDDLLD
jgi:hypothetical protein